MNSTELIRFCQNLMIKSENGYFTTLSSDGFPITRAVFNLKNTSKFPTIKSVVTSQADPFFTLIGTNTESQKVRELQKNPKANLYYCIPDQFQGLSLSGTIEICEDLEFKRQLWVEGWEIYYPQGYHDPDFCILHLIPHYARGWYGSGKYAFSIRYDNGEISYNFE